MYFTTAAAISALVAGASAATQTVTVGANGGLTYTPNTVTAATGDTINFVFMSKNHTVTQSTFGAPCSQKADGFDSSYIFVPNTTAQNQLPSWSITLTNTEPVWVYCKQAKHCGAGMVLAINPTADKTFNEFLATAKATVANGTATTNGTTPSAPVSAGVPGASSAPPTAATGVAGANSTTGVAGAAGANGTASASGSGASAAPPTPTNGAESIKHATGFIAVVAVVMGLML